MKQARNVYKLVCGSGIVSNLLIYKINDPLPPTLVLVHADCSYSFWFQINFVSPAYKYTTDVLEYVFETYGILL